MSTSQFDQRWDGWASARGYLGSGTPGYGNLGVFVPLSQDASSLWFSQINGKVFDGGLIEGNLAVGHRQITSSGFNIGFWGGLDMRKTASDNLFGQVSGGVEALSKYFDFRANGYLPLNGAQTAAAGSAQVLLSGSNIFMVGAKEVPLYGVDAEAGLRLPFGNNAGHLGVYGGGYWFNNKDVYQAVTGFKARVELALNDVVGPGSSLTARYQYSDDKARGVRQVFGVGLRIPFGGSSARPARATSGQRWRMTDPLERDTDIVIGQSQKQHVADGYTGVTFYRVAYANDDTTLQNGIDKGANTLIILDGANNPVSGGETLGSQQTLLGGGGTLKVTGVDTGTIGYVTAPGSRPTISNISGSGYALTLAGYNTVDGVDVTSSLTGTGITGVALGGIDGSGESHLAIVDTNVNVSMTGTGSNGVSGGTGTDGGNGISGNSTLTGINLASADQVWLDNTTVTATMTGTGGNGGKGGNYTTGGDGGAGGDGGVGITGSNTLTGIDLANADHVWLGNTTVTAIMTGRGGDGGNGGDGSTSTTIGTGGTGGIGGGGIDGGTLTGIQLASAQNMSLTNTMVSATMAGTGGAGGDGGNNHDPGYGGAGGAGGTGIAGSTVHGIDLSSFVGSAWLTNTAVTATMNGTGGAGGSGGGSGSGGVAGAGGTGINAGSTVHGIDLSGFVGSAWLTNTVVTATMNGTGGAGGNGGDGFGGGEGGAGGTGVDDGTVYGIDATNGNDAWWTNTVVTATINSTGGAGGDGGGGGEPSDDGKAGDGGTGINAGELFGIAFGTPNSYSLTDTTVVATLNGLGGHGGPNGHSGSGASGTGISGITPHGLYPDTMPIPGVIFSGSTIVTVTP